VKTTFALARVVLGFLVNDFRPHFEVSNRE
jgi:hypothetical protein